jgi:hypothetical protein
MIYSPIYKTVNEILINNGFTYNHKGRGWIKPIRKDARLHAIIQDKEINLHFDEPREDDITKHKCRRFCKSVEREIKKIKKYDMSFKPSFIDKLYNGFFNLIERIVGKIISEPEWWIRK